MTHYVTQAERKRIRNDMAVWMANALLKHCKDKLDPYTKEVAERVIRKKWAGQHEYDHLKKMEEKHNPFDDEGPSVDD